MFVRLTQEPLDRFASNLSGVYYRAVGCNDELVEVNPTIPVLVKLGEYQPRHSVCYILK